MNCRIKTRQAVFASISICHTRTLFIISINNIGPERKKTCKLISSSGETPCWDAIIRRSLLIAEGRTGPVGLGAMRDVLSSRCGDAARQERTRGRGRAVNSTSHITRGWSVMEGARRITVRALSSLPNPSYFKVISHSSRHVATGGPFKGKARPLVGNSTSWDLRDLPKCMFRT